MFGLQNLFQIIENILREYYIPIFDSNFRKIYLGILAFQIMFLTQYSLQNILVERCEYLHSHNIQMS